TPYFAQRPTEDLLGKNDRHVAKLPPRGVFSPGHDKWDYQYSLGERRADLIVEPVDVDEADAAYMKELGFEELPNGMLLRRPTSAARPDVLGREVDDGRALSHALSEVGFTLPRSLALPDFLMVLVFGFVAFAAARKVVKDDESFEALSPEPPAEPELDEASKQALAGADARAIPTLDGMRGIAV